MSEVEGNLLFYCWMHRQGHDMPLAQIPEVCMRARLQARRRGAEKPQAFQGRQRLAPDVSPGLSRSH